MSGVKVHDAFWCCSLFDDESVRKKLGVLSKWEAMNDDSRNDDGQDVMGEIERHLQLGRKYRIILSIEDVGEATE